MAHPPPARPRRPGGDDPFPGRPSSPLITFNTVPEPKTVKNRVHLDVTQRFLRRRDRTPAEPGYPQAPRPAARQVPLDDLRRHRRQRVRPDRPVDPEAITAILLTHADDTEAGAARTVTAAGQPACPFCDG